MSQSFFQQKPDHIFMKEALKEAQIALQNGEVPVGAVIVKEGQIIARGHNRREELQSALSHAEIHAIRAANQALASWRLTGCTLYVTLEPCPMCAGAIWNARLSRVVYGAKDPQMGAVGSIIHMLDMPFGDRPSLTTGVLETPCSALLSSFFKELRNKAEKQSGSPF